MRFLFALLLSCQLRATDAQVMADWYAENWPDKRHGRPGEVLEVGLKTEYYANLLGLDCYGQTMLSQWHRESAYRNVRGLDGKSIGYTQTIIGRQNHWRQFWKLYGVRLGGIRTMDFQVAAGVAEFKEHLDLARGDVWEAVRRYNGSGPRAREYADRVFKTRQVVFGVPPPSRKQTKKKKPRIAYCRGFSFS